jgi:hypothetical protein
VLAEMIGTTRSRVSFFMNRFRKLGFIHYNGGLQVHSSLLNVVLPTRFPRGISKAESRALNQSAICWIYSGSGPIFVATSTSNKVAVL